MCGRFSSQSTSLELVEAFGLEGIRAGVPPRYNIAPTDEVSVVINDGTRSLDAFRWGLVPFWAHDPSIAHRLINARLESLGARPAFRSAARKRCLILADGFYEWHVVRGARRAVYVRRRDRRPFAFAGVWDRWRDIDGESLRTCAIVTVEASARLAALHRRMPLILPPRLYDRWLSPSPTALTLWQQLLAHPGDAALELYPVSPYVNTPGHEGPGCIRPAFDLWGGEPLGPL